LTSALAITFHGITKENTSARVAARNSSIHFAAQRYAVDETKLVLTLSLLKPSQTCTVCEFHKIVGGDWRILTFDDGLVSDYELVLPALVKRGFRATFFVNSDTIGKKGYCSQSQLREMIQSGMEIGSHGRTHGYLVTLPASEATKEIEQSKNALEDLLGTEVTSFAPVGGHFRNWMTVFANRAGYKAFATMIPGRTVVRQMGLLLLRRNHIQTAHSEDYIRRIIAAKSGTLAGIRCRYLVLYAARRVLGMGTYDLMKAKLLGTPLESQRTGRDFYRSSL